GGVQAPVLARRAQPILDPAAADQGDNVAARILQVARNQARLGLLAPAEAHDALDAVAAGVLGPPPVKASFAGEQRPGTPPQARGKRGAIVGARLLRDHSANMLRRDRG